MLAGATLIAPETVFLSMDTKIGRDVTIEPQVVFGPGVTIDDDVVIHAFSHLEGARVASGASVGPFARLRPGADLAAKAKVGNFVEVKAAQHRGRRQGQPPDLHRRRQGRRGRQHRRRDDHLQLRRLLQVQDRHRRRRLHRLQLRARRAGPIGDGAYVGSGSVITDDVEPDALAIARGRQYNKPGGRRRSGRRKARSSAGAAALLWLSERSRGDGAGDASRALLVRHFRDQHLAARRRGQMASRERAASP